MTKQTKTYSGYKKVQVKVEWKKIVMDNWGSKILGWYHPRTNVAVWDCYQPPDTIHYEWQSTAELATGIKPMPMRTYSRWREPDEKK
jgi:hypothetical protein